MHASEAEHQMNALGAARRPFFFVVDFEQTHCYLWPLDTLPDDILKYAINGKTNAGFQEKKEVIQFEKYPIDFEEYKSKFDIVQKHLSAGNSFLTNLTVPTKIITSAGLQTIFYQSAARYKLWLNSAALGHPDLAEICCFSPEIFIQIAHNQLAVFPMKGTANGDIPGAEEALLQDEKERFEHATIVDLLRNDIARFCTQRWVERFRYIEKIHTNGKNLLQVSSEIRGTLPPNWQASLGELLFGLLPAGSISGAPKTKTLEIIAEAEGQPRYFYTGIFGIFDSETLDTGVMIRYLERTHTGELRYRSGGGITARSNAQNEYQEMIDKVYIPTNNDTNS